MPRAVCCPALCPRCMRRAVLEDRAQLTERNARAAAGTLVHDLFEAALVGGGVPEPAEAWVRRRAVEIRGRRAELLFEARAHE